MIYCVLSPPNPRYLEGPVVPVYHSVPQPQVFDIKLSPNDFVFLNISAPGVFKYNPTDAFLNIFISCVRERGGERERERERVTETMQRTTFLSRQSLIIYQHAGQGRQGSVIPWYQPTQSRVTGRTLAWPGMLNANIIIRFLQIVTWCMYNINGSVGLTSNVNLLEIDPGMNFNSLCYLRYNLARDRRHRPIQSIWSKVRTNWMRLSWWNRISRYLIGHINHDDPYISKASDRNNMVLKAGWRKRNKYFFCKNVLTWLADDTTPGWRTGVAFATQNIQI